MPVYELINPSDPYTFEAPDIEVAAVAVVLLSTHYGAKELPDGESTPILFGWTAWLDDRGIDDPWIDAHAAAVADALDSFLIGDAEARVAAQRQLEELPEAQRAEWRAARQERQRTSMNRIGEAAYQRAARLRARSA